MFRIAILLLTLAIGTTQASAMKIQSIKSKGGIEAWLVEEHGLPMFAMHFGFNGGASQDPAGKPGVSNLLTAMLDEGAGDMNAQAFQTKLEDLAIKMSFDSGRDIFTGSLQTLVVNRDQAASLVKLALSKPRFDLDSIVRMKKSITANIQVDDQEPGQVADDNWYKIAFPGHPYANPVTGTVATVAAITPADLHDYVNRVFTRDNLKIGVVGDIDPETLGTFLDTVFGDLPAKGSLTPVPDVMPKAGPTEVVIPMDVPQSVVEFGGVGLKRNDPDFIAGFVLNHILGGGGFSSRLMEEVREKRGLAYSVSSTLLPYRNSAIYIGSVATKNASVKTALGVIRSEIERIAKDGPTDEELTDAKQFLTGSYALRFNSSGRIAGQLVGLQIENLGIDYIDKRNSLVDAITITDIRRAAARYLKPGELIVTIVGKPD